MNTLLVLIKRHTKLFFKDKGMFLTALITPMILLILYATFLANLYKDNFLSSIPENVQISSKLIDALVAGQLVSSLFAVSCVTVSFCTNFLMVQDKANGTSKDLMITPIRSSVLSLSYFIASFLSSFMICFIGAGISFIYLAIVGFYLTIGDVFLFLFDVFLLVLFGTALSSLINIFLKTMGQISAVGTIVSAGYGFICGAYMPIASFSQGLQNVVMFLPGTYGTSLLRNHATNGVFQEMMNQGLPSSVITEMKNALDCNLYFFNQQVSIGVMYLILIVSTLLFIVIYVLVHRFKKTH